MLLIDPPPFSAPDAKWREFAAWLKEQDPNDPIVQMCQRDVDERLPLSARKFDHVLKYSPGQPRNPKGTPTGGQFTSGKASGAGTPTDPADIDLSFFDQHDTGYKDQWGNPYTLSAAEGVADDMQGLIVDAGKEQGGEYDADAKAKMVVCRNLAEKLDGNPAWEKLKVIFNEPDSEQMASKLVHQWAHTSSNDSPMSLFLQEMATAEFGLTGYRHAVQNSDEHKNKSVFELGADLLTLQWRKPQHADALRPNENEYGGPIWQKEHVDTLANGMRVFLREMYNQTQADLKAHNITQVAVFRGVEGEKQHYRDGYHDLRLHPMSSFAASPGVAWEFAAQTSRGKVFIVQVPASRILSTPRTGFGCRKEDEVVVLGGDTKGVVLPSHQVSYGWAEWVRKETKRARARRQAHGTD